MFVLSRGLIRVHADFKKGSGRPLHQIRIDRRSNSCSIRVAYIVHEQRALRSRLLAFFQVSISLGVDGVPLECFGQAGYVNKLRFWIVAPIAAIAVVVVGVVVVLVRKSGTRGRGLSLAANLRRRSAALRRAV